MFDRAVNLIGLCLSALSFYYAFLAARRSRAATMMVARTHVAEELRRCHSLARQLMRIFPAAGTADVLSWLQELHSDLIVVRTRHAAALTEEDLQALTEVLQACRRVWYDVRRGVDRSQLEDIVAYVATQCLEVSARQHRLVDAINRDRPSEELVP